MIIPRMIVEKLIHNGDNTHTHDQSITFVSFKAINNIVSKPVNPIPDELLLLLDVFPIFILLL